MLIMPRNFTGSIPVDLEILETIGESIPSLIRGEIEFGEIIKTTELLNRFFKRTYGLDAYLRELGKIACQIGNRFPHINILELGMLGLTWSFTIRVYSQVLGF